MIHSKDFSTFTIFCLILFSAVACAHEQVTPENSEITSSSARSRLKYGPIEGEKRVPFVRGIVLRDGPEVRKALHYYTKKNRAYVEDGLRRREPFLAMIEKVLTETGLPIELSNLAFLESRFVPDARSRKGATGLWQLMPTTARSLGLKVSIWRDDRRDPEKSTKAAAAYLLELYDRFDNWPLALAAYNAGPSKISRAIKRCGTRDFYQLHSCGRLNNETINFVSKFIALTMIARNPQAYDFIEKAS